MNIQHEIISFHAPTGSMLVRYYSEEVPEGLHYNIDIPLENGAFVGQEQINALIEAMKPVGQLERIFELQTVEIPAALAALIPQQVEQIAVDTTPPTIEGADAPPVA